MEGMFECCNSLQELNFSFIIKKKTNVEYMFFKIPQELKLRIKNQCKDIKDEAFTGAEYFYYI